MKIAMNILENIRLFFHFMETDFYYSTWKYSENIKVSQK